MKKIILILSALLLTACSNHMVKVGKRCTPLGNDNTYEKSFVWLVNKANLESFDEKINYLLIKLYNQAKIAPPIPKSTKPQIAPIILPSGVKL